MKRKLNPFLIGIMMFITCFIGFALKRNTVGTPSTTTETRRTSITTGSHVDNPTTVIGTLPTPTPTPLPEIYTGANYLTTDKGFELYGIYKKEENTGNYKFYMEKIKWTAGGTKINERKIISNHYAEIYYDRNTKCMTIQGDGPMFYDDYPRSLDLGEADGDNRWHRIKIPFEKQALEVTVKPGVKEISRYAFGGFKNVQTINLPNSLKKIKAFAFHDCGELKELTIPDSVETIGRESIYNCKSLRKLTIGKNVKKIATGNFGKCTSLTEIKVADGNQYFTVYNGILYGKKDKTIYFNCNRTESSIVFPDGVKKIETYAFAQNKLKTVMIPASVEKIMGGAFWKCQNLKKVIFEPNAECKKFETYFVPYFDYGTVYGAFSECENLQTFKTPDKVKKLCFCLLGCTSLTNIHIGKSLHGNKGKKPFRGEIPSSLLHYTVSPENPWYSSRNGKLYNKAGTKLLDDPTAKKKNK